MRSSRATSSTPTSGRRRGVLPAIFAIFLWPSVLLGIDLHVKK
jgi:hypothetical protein